MLLNGRMGPFMKGDMENAVIKRDGSESFTREQI